jgi:hypothetical protein
MASALKVSARTLQNWEARPGASQPNKKTIDPRDLLSRMDDYVLSLKEKEWLSSRLEAFGGRSPRDLIREGRFAQLASSMAAPATTTVFLLVSLSKNAPEQQRGSTVWLRGRAPKHFRSRLTTSRQSGWPDNGYSRQPTPGDTYSVGWLKKGHCFRRRKRLFSPLGRRSSLRSVMHDLAEEGLRKLKGGHRISQCIVTDEGPLQ